MEVVLGIHILEVTVVTEKTMNYHPEFHGVRLDVLAVENRNWEVKYMQFREMLRDEHEEGLQEGRLQGETNATLEYIRGLMKNLQWTAEQAMDALGLSAEQQQKYRGMI